MTISVFTSNQPRHLALIEALAAVAERVYAVQECNTVFPGRVLDFFQRSEIMQDYFERVIAAEAEVFGRPRFAPANVTQLPIKMGDLNMLELETFGTALEADVFVIFGAGYIKGPLCEYLVARRAVNIHMGVSPYYRGSATNFWALYDNRPEYVGATIHLLTAGLDSGPILFHALPRAEALDPFLLGMRAVRVAHEAMVERIASGQIQDLESVVQDKRLELRYSRNADFTDAVAAEYLARLPAADSIESALCNRDLSQFVQPYVRQ